jgi:hypothetical protein
MKYDITKTKAPAMPTLGKGTECIKILLSQASKDMHEHLISMFFPLLGAYMSGSEFQYTDLKTLLIPFSRPSLALLSSFSYPQIVTKKAIHRAQ